MYMHNNNNNAYVRTRIRPRLDFSWTGRQCRRGGFGMPPPQCEGRPPRRRALGRACPLRCSVPINQRQSRCVAAVAIAISNNPVFWVEDVLSAVFNRRRISDAESDTSSDSESDQTVSLSPERRYHRGICALVPLLVPRGSPIDGRTGFKRKDQ